MCIPAVAIVGIVGVVASIGGTIATMSAQQSAASENARVQQETAAANARASASIAEVNADAEFQIAQANANAVRATSETQATIAESSAVRADTAAEATRQAGLAEEARRRTQSMMMLSDQRARFGAAGVILEGSPLEVLAFSAGQEELDALTIRQNSAVKVNDLTTQAAGIRLESALGTRDAAMRARNLLSDAITRGETGRYTAGISGGVGVADAALRGQAGISNAASASMGTLASGIGSAVSSSAASRLWGSFSSGSTVSGEFKNTTSKLNFA